MNASNLEKSDLLSEKSLLGASCMPLALMAAVMILSSCDDARNNMPRSFKPVNHPHFTRMPNNNYVFISGTDLAFAKRAPEIYKRQYTFSPEFEEIDYNFEEERQNRRRHYERILPRSDLTKISNLAKSDVQKDKKNTTDTLFKNYKDNFFNIIANANIEAIKEAIEKGADINAFDEETKLNPIMTAAKYVKNPEIIDLLVKAGADIKSVNYEGLNSLMVASQFNNDISIHEKLISLGIDINQTTSKGITALLLAASSNPEIKVTAFLLKEKAKINPQIAEHGIPPLLIAARFTKNPEIINLLIQSGSNANITSLGDGNNPLLSAARYNPNPEIIKMLLRHKANIEARLKSGETPLILAAKHNTNPEIVVTLIEEGANVLAKDNSNNNAVYYAKDNSNLYGTTSYFYLDSKTEIAIADAYAASIARY